MMVSVNDYPLSEGFLSPMPAAVVSRLRATGWQREGAIFLQIPFSAISAAGEGIGRDYEHRVWYEVFYATEGVISGLTDAELRVVVDHEHVEAASAAEEAMQGQLEITTQAAEHERHLPEIQRLEQAYGVDLVRGTIAKAQTLADLKPRITRMVLLFWICRHVTLHFNENVKHARPMTSQNVLSRPKKQVHASALRGGAGIRRPVAIATVQGVAVGRGEGLMPLKRHLDLRAVNLEVMSSLRLFTRLSQLPGADPGGRRRSADQNRRSSQRSVSATGSGGRDWPRQW